MTVTGLDESKPNNGPLQPAQAPQPMSYVAHSTGAAVGAGAVLIILSWVLSMFHITMPAEVAAAGVTILTPMVSWAQKKLGVLSD